MFLHGIGHFHPQTVLDNQFLVGLDIGVDEEWILQRVGIRARRTVLPLDYIRETANRDPRAAAEAALYTNAQTGAFAARMALERAGLAPERIGMVVAGGCSPQWTIPAEACVIAAELGLNVPAFDVNSACSSFGVQVRLLEQMGDGLPDFVLIVNPENNTRTVNYTDRANAVLWGDASSAAVVSTRVPAPVKMGSCEMGSDPSRWAKVTIPSGGHFAQEGPTVQAFAIRKMTELAQTVRRHLDREDTYFIGHQANLMALKSVCERSGVAPGKHLYNVDVFGNCGAAGVPSVLSQHWSCFRRNDCVAIALVGSGLTWSGLWVSFAADQPAAENRSNAVAGELPRFPALLEAK